MIKINDLLSIYIPTYNRVNYLKTCLDNVIKEAEKLDLKIFISDNNSQDSTESLVKEYKKKYNHIIYYKQSEKISLDENQLYFLRLVDTKFCLMIADDDGVELNALDNILNILELYPRADVILLNSNHYTADMQTRKYANFSIKENQILNDPRVLLRDYFFYMHFSTLVVNMEHSRLVNTTRYQETYHAYCGLVFDYLNEKNSNNNSIEIIITSNPMIKLRDGDKTYSKEMIDVYYKRFPSFFTYLPSLYSIEARQKIKQLSKDNTKTLFLIWQRREGHLCLNNSRDTFLFLGLFQKLKIISVSIIPRIVFTIIIYLYRYCRKIKNKYVNRISHIKKI